MPPTIRRQAQLSAAAVLSKELKKQALAQPRDGAWGEASTKEQIEATAERIRTQINQQITHQEANGGRGALDQTITQYTQHVAGRADHYNKNKAEQNTIASTQANNKEY